MMVMINGFPGVGKLTIARLLAAKLDARLLDNHTIFNPANALFRRDNPLWSSLRHALTSAVHDHLARDTSAKPIIMTGSFGDSPADQTAYASVIGVAQKRNCPFVAITLTAHIDENARRLSTPERAERHKLVDEAALRDLYSRATLLQPIGVPHVALDVTSLTPAQSAAALYDAILQQLSASQTPSEDTHGRLH
jgi:predicted kinase